MSLDNVRLWNSQAEQAEQKPIFLRPDPPRDRIFRAAFSRDGNYLITGTISGLAQIWDLCRKTTMDKGDCVLGPLGEPVHRIGTTGTSMIGYVGFSPPATLSLLPPDMISESPIHFISGACHARPCQPK